MNRPDWDSYFSNIAQTASVRATCKRLKVGAVIVLDRRILATGYNGSVAGMPHCEEVGCDVVDGHCIRTIHAEMNAIGQAVKHGVAIEGATIYTTAAPCWSCFRVCVNAGITRYVYASEYRPDVSRSRIEEVVNASRGRIAVELLTPEMMLNNLLKLPERGPSHDANGSPV